jgi:hypothetical protein
MSAVSRRLFVAAAALVLAACASTSIRDSWYDSAYRGGAFRKVLVVFVANDIANRRVAEDVVAGKLAATGVEALPAYRFLADGGRVDEATFDRAVRESGADAVLLIRVKGVDSKTQVSQVMMPAPVGMGFGYYGWYSGWYPVTEVRQYEIAIVETSLFEVATKRVVWSGVTETYEPRSVAQEAPGFADVIVKALRERGLLPGK